MKKNSLAQASAMSCLLFSSASAMAVELIANDTTTLSTEGEAVLGIFNSEKSYQLRDDDDGSTWQEGYLKFGLTGERKFSQGTLYGKANLLASFTGGDGDAGGFSTGDESEIDTEDLFVGFKNGLFDVSVGSQNYTIGDGFLVQGDALNFGEGFDQFGADLDRGGSYWLAARKVFNQTAILKVGREAGPRAEVFYLNSNNPGQASTELTGVNLEYRSTIGTFGFTYLSGQDVDDEEAGFLGVSSRDGQDTTSIRFQGNAGVENLFLSAEFVDQSQGDATREDANAGYAELGWTFADKPWSPSVNYRFSSYDETYDPLFNGFSRGYGTWFQGEVAGNYAGPFNTNTDVHFVGITAQPQEVLTVGASFFAFDPKEGDGLEATEINFWGEYVVTTAPIVPIIINPLIGLYTPENSAEDGGTQFGDDDTNFYAQLFVVVPF